MKYSSIVIGAAIAATLTACGGGGGGSSSPPSTSAPAAMNAPPSISAIENQSVAQDAVSNPVGFEVSDPASDPATIKVAVSSSNAELIADDAIALSGNDAARELRFSPTPSLSGTSTLTLTATDAQGESSQRSFVVNVTSAERSFREMVGTAYLKDSEVEGEPIVGYTWVDSAEDDEAAFDHLLAP